ncbi:MAG: hypothetical protein K5651_05900, partial [Bacteroidales bacterium]|nr:hypothetical protein [Bacteroidales bacterium]
MMKRFFLAGVCCLFCLNACEKLMDEIPLVTAAEEEAPPITLSQTARILSGLPIGSEQMGEVHDAVSASIDNGFDEEYLLSDLFEAPGSGVGERELAEKAKLSGVGTRAGKYARPLRELIRAALQEKEVRSSLCRSVGQEEVRSSLCRSVGQEETADESEGTFDAEAYIQSLCESGVQIYWPYSENWDGKSLPIITYDPGYGLESNTGWRINPEGKAAEEVMVDENLARSGCVWVVNSNEDADLTPLSYLRKSDPSWGLPDHGTIVIDPQESALSGVTGGFRSGAAGGFRSGAEEGFRADAEEGFRSGAAEGTKATSGSKTLL